MWSFGVTAWYVLLDIKSPCEIQKLTRVIREMIYNREPYEGWDLLELALKIRETCMHPDVSTCPDEFLRDLMLKCWAKVHLTHIISL